MVKISIIALLCIFSLVSCSIFFLTPFPGELIFYNKSVQVEDINQFNYTRLYAFDEYVFLYVAESDEFDDDQSDKLYIYTKDLELIYEEYLFDEHYDDKEVDTFAMKDAQGFYFIGKFPQLIFFYE